jgi:Tol biopolymer transport system component
MKHASLAATLLLLTTCVLPGEPSGAERIEFQLDFALPYRVPLAGTVEPAIRITAGGQVLTNPRYRLESLDGGVLRVDATGRGLEGLARDTASVRVIYQTATGASDTVFPVQVVVSRIAVGSPVTSLTRLGATTYLSATAFDAKDATVPNVAFTWSSAAPQVASVNDTGLVTAVDEGTVAITAEADSVKGLASIMVTQVAAVVRLAPELDTLRTVGRSAQFIAVALDEAGRVLQGARPRWTSSDPLVATVDAAGLVTATGTGTARIIARVGEAADTGTLVVAQVIRFLVVHPGLDTLTAIADTGRLAALAFDTLNFPIPNPSVGWATSDAAVATVDQAGLVRAAGNGVVLVTASAGGQAGFATVVVRQEVATAHVSPDNVALTGEGDTVRLSAVGLDRNGYPVVDASFGWRSGAECVATVDAAGLITARGGGEASITAAPANGGPSDTAMVSVTGAPPGGVDIAFVSPRGIEALCSGGGGAVVLIQNGSGSVVSDPSWSPDGVRLAFTRIVDAFATCEIYAIRADGSELRRVTSGSPCDLHPAWSPDGTTLAFASGDFPCTGDCMMTLALVNVDGSNQRDLAFGESPWYTNPTWSSDGTKIAFENYDWNSCYDIACGHYEISVRNADGSGGGNLTNFPRTSLFDDNTEPAWSPDGSQIAFVRLGDIWLMNADGSGGRSLTSTPGSVFETNPAWSPDGSALAFARADGYGSQYDLYLVNRDGTGLRRLTSTAESESNPSWRPATPPVGPAGGAGVTRTRP